jgi:Uma2 family endonuclease
MSAVLEQPEVKEFVVTVPPEKRRYTYDQLLAEMPETNQPHELWDGELMVMPSPAFAHQEIVLNFYRQLFAWVAARSLGKVVTAPMDMVLSPHRAVQPDVLFISKERLSIIQNQVRGPADLVVEVISLGSRQRDRIEKRDLYEQYGVKEYWIVDPESEMIEVLVLVNGRYELGCRVGIEGTAASRLMPGFEVSSRSLFRPPSA